MRSMAAAKTGSIPARYCEDRKSTRLNSSHLVISYAVFCLKKKKHLSNCGRYAEPHLNRLRQGVAQLLTSFLGSQRSGNIKVPETRSLKVFHLLTSLELLSV